MEKHLKMANCYPLALLGHTRLAVPQLDTQDQGQQVMTGNMPSILAGTTYKPRDRQGGRAHIMILALLKQHITVCTLQFLPGVTLNATSFIFVVRQTVF